ncbi:transcriptional regulator, LysR family [Roseobacter sp. GAI101]|nr:transcriptional regulator, LysR family [Roseobacter sp. GAI101]
MCNKENLTLSDLAGERFISFPEGEPLRYEMEQILFNEGVDVNFVVETSYSAITCSLVAKGVGIAIVNPYIAHTCGESGIVVKPFDSGPKHEAVLIYPKGKPRGRFVESFVAVLKQMVSDF